MLTKKKSSSVFYAFILSALFLAACSDKDETPNPVISSFTPTRGAAGTLVTVTGSNFGSAPTVRLGGVPAVVQSASETSIVFAVPASASGAMGGKITVATADGKLTTSADNFNTLPTPVIESFSPEKAGVGKTITIKGQGLSDATVTLGGMAATVSINSGTEIQVVVPAGATSGKITVTTDGGTVESAVAFTIDPHTISDVASALTYQTTNIISPGQKFFIRGENFSPTPADNIVTVNGVTMPVVAGDSKMLIVSVPSTAVSGGQLTVTIGTLTIAYDTDLVMPPGRWVKLADFPGDDRQGASTFVVGSKGYMGTGLDASTDPFSYYNDFWEFDPATKAWTQKPAASTTGRWNSIAFTIDGKGYMGGGSPNFLRDFWQYDPSNNTWTQKASIPNLVTIVQCGFSANGKGYLYGSDQVWEYNPSTDQWTQKADFPGDSRIKPVAVVINNKVYFGTGTADYKTGYSDFWEFNPAANQWTRKADLPSARFSCVAFAINGKAYVGAGTDATANGDVFVPDFYMYDPTTDQWTISAPFPSSVASGNISFSIDGKGYAGLSGAFSSKEFWEFQPE